MKIPDKITSTEGLESFLAEPYSQTIDAMRNMKGDIIILGVGGKMGPSLAHLAVNATRRAGVKRRIIGVSRFSNPAQEKQLQHWGVETISCDLSKPEEMEKLPHAENVIFMAGRKFGSSGTEPETWLLNTIVPGVVARYFRQSKMVVFSTGCVYDFACRETGGSKESDRPRPVGEYASSCLGRERVFEYYANVYNSPTLMFRLNYAIDLRYGVLTDIGISVYNELEIDISVDDVNIIWQGDANNRALLCLEHTDVPPAILNITGSEILSVSNIAGEFGKIFNKGVRLNGEPNTCSYLSNAAKSVKLFGEPAISVGQMIRWTADWIRQGGETYGKPTLFQVTDGDFLL